MSTYLPLIERCSLYRSGIEIYKIGSVLSFEMTTTHSIEFVATTAKTNKKDTRSPEDEKEWQRTIGQNTRSILLERERERDGEDE